MSEIADSIIKEYQSELDEKLEDDKHKIQVSQAISLGGSLWRYFSYFVHAFFINVVVVATIYLAVIDVATIELIKASSAEELLQTISFFFTVVGYLQFLLAVIMGMFFYRRFYIDKRQERIDQDNYDTYLTAKIVSLAEEVLKRHEINKEGLS
ncbi:hypothetical protein [Aliikangiella maris]|uniref:Uncharacterized protein n=2 Tax=Aliikangiella maris TaxID=3162458 RepID=A0ABV2BYF9_9GAMM